MLFHDTKHHNKPHVHVYYGEYEASVGVDGELLAGSLPRKQMKIIVDGLPFMKRKCTQLGTGQSKVGISTRLMQCREDRCTSSTIYAMQERLEQRFGS